MSIKRMPTRARDKATQAQRNELARVQFAQVVINDDRLAAIQPQAKFAPFFVLDYHARTGSSGSDLGPGRRRC